MLTYAKLLTATVKRRKRFYDADCLAVLRHFDYIYRELDVQHNTPHFHAKYAEFESVYNFAGNIIEGDLPKRQRKLVEAWCELHADELNAAWTAWNESGEIIKIQGLR